MFFSVDEVREPIAEAPDFRPRELVGYADFTEDVPMMGKNPQRFYQ
jgi:hypothetical protein